MTDNEAARKYAESLGDGLYFGDSPMTRARIHAFMKGAEWKEQQFLERVVTFIQENIARDFCFDEELRGIIPDFIEDLKRTVTTKKD